MPVCSTVPRPQEAESFCGHNRDVTFRSQLHKPRSSLALKLIREVKPIYQRLNDDQLLSWCLDGETPNPNKDINVVIWDSLSNGVLKQINI